jgi:hypothetical protein
MYNTLEDYKYALNNECLAQYFISTSDLFDEDEVQEMFDNKEDIAEAVTAKGIKYGLDSAKDIL